MKHSFIKTFLFLITFLFCANTLWADWSFSYKKGAEGAWTYNVAPAGDGKVHVNLDAYSTYYVYALVDGNGWASGDVTMTYGNSTNYDLSGYGDATYTQLKLQTTLAGEYLISLSWSDNKQHMTVEYPYGVFLPGSWNGWAVTEDVMFDSANSLILHLAAGNYNFKVMNDRAWFGCTGTMNGPQTDWTFYSSNNNECVINISREGDYKFTYRWENSNPIVSVFDVTDKYAGNLGHFATPTNTKVHYDIAYVDDKVVYMLRSTTGNPLDFAQIQVNGAGYNMQIVDGYATYEMSGATLGAEQKILFLYSDTNMGGNEMTAEGFSDDAHLVSYVVGEGAATLTEDVNYIAAACAANHANITASSNPDNSWESGDGNEGSRWASVNGDGHNIWWQADLGERKMINVAQIVWEGAWGRSYDIQYSNDALHWYNYVSLRNLNLSGFPLTINYKEGLVAARYIRFQGVEKATEYGYSFWELQARYSTESILTRVVLTADKRIAKINTPVTLTSVARDQNDAVMSDMEFSYSVSPADAGEFVGNVFTPAKSCEATITVTCGEKQASVPLICAVSDNLAQASALGDGKIVGQSTAFNNAYFAVDGNLESTWQGAPTDGTNVDEAARTYESWFVVDLGDNYDIDAIVTYFEGAWAADYTLQLSLDNLSWTTVFSQTGGRDVLPDSQRYKYLASSSFSTPVASARYVKFHSTKAATQYGMKIFEFFVFGVEGAKEKLATPTGVTVTDGSVSFTAVEHATSYEAHIYDGGEEVYTQTVVPAGTVLTYVPASNKTLTVKVVAKDNNYLDSDESEAANWNYSYYLSVPTGLTLNEETGVISFTGDVNASSFEAYIYYNSVEYAHQSITSGAALTKPAAANNAYKVKLVAVGDDNPYHSSVESDGVDWYVAGKPRLNEPSRYCAKTMLSAGGNWVSDETSAALFTWETMNDGSVVITIAPRDPETQTKTEFRSNAMTLANFHVGDPTQNNAETYFNRTFDAVNNPTQIILTPKTELAYGTKIYYGTPSNAAMIEYRTQPSDVSANNSNLYPNFKFEYTYGTYCNGAYVFVSTAVNNAEWGTATVQQNSADVTYAAIGSAVTFVATPQEGFVFENWTDASGVVVSTAENYTINSLSEDVSLTANFDYVREIYCHTPIISNGGAHMGRTMYLSMGYNTTTSKYFIKYEGSFDTKLTSINDANFTINGVNSGAQQGDNVPFTKVNGLWQFDAAGNGSAWIEFDIADGKTWKDIHVWNHSIYFLIDGFPNDCGYTSFPGRNTINWTNTCAQASTPVINDVSVVLVKNNSVTLSVDATDDVYVIDHVTITDAANGLHVDLPYNSGNVLISGLNPNTTYNFQLTATNAAGVTSERSDVEPVTTLLSHPTTSAAIPPLRNEADVRSIYSDFYDTALAHDFGKNFYATIDVTEEQISGNHYILNTYSGSAREASWGSNDGGQNAFVAVKPAYRDGANTGVDVRSMEYLHVDIWTFNEENLTFRLRDEELATNIHHNGLGWQSFDIPLYRNGNSVCALNNIQWMKFQGFNNSPTFAIDNVYFYKQHTEATIPLTVTAVPAVGGNAQAEKNDFKVVLAESGETGIDFVARVNEGYRFLGWTDDNNDNAEISAELTYSPGAIMAPIALTAHFRKTYNVQAASQNVLMGSAAVMQAEQEVAVVDDGSEVAFVAAPATGCQFQYWTMGGDVVSSDNPYVVAVSEDMNLVAHFDYYRTTFCREPIQTNDGRTLYLTCKAIEEAGQTIYHLIFEGSEEVQIRSLNNPNYVITGVTELSAWQVDNAGYGSISRTFKAADYHNISWAVTHYLAIGTTEGERIVDTYMPSANDIDWTTTCVDDEPPYDVTVAKFAISETAAYICVSALDKVSTSIKYTITYKPTGTPGAGTNVVASAAPRQQHAFYITDLIKDTEYTFTLHVEDNGGNVVTPDKEFTLTPGDDYVRGASKPITPAGIVRAIYSDRYIVPVKHDFLKQNWGSASAAEIERDGDHMLLYIPTGPTTNWIAWGENSDGGNAIVAKERYHQDGKTGIDMSEMDYMHVDIWSIEPFTFRQYVVDGHLKNTDDSYIWRHNGGGWQSYDIPLTAFEIVPAEDKYAGGYALNNVAWVKWDQIHGTTAMFIDNVYFYKDVPAKEFYYEGDNLWSTAANWTNGQLPTSEELVFILKDCIVDVPNAEGKDVVLSTEGTFNGSLTVASTGALAVHGKLYRVEDDFYDEAIPVRTNDVLIESSAAGQGALAIANEDGSSQLTMHLYSPAVGDAAAKVYQYIGVPFSDMTSVLYQYYGSWMYQWNTASNGWAKLPTGAPADPWIGYAICYKKEGGSMSHTYGLTGTLLPTAGIKTIALSNEGDGNNMIGNSWTAPIRLADLNDADFVNAEKTISIYNTGSYAAAQGLLATSSDGTSRTAGQWNVIPIHAASYTGKLAVIPPMQGFLVNATGAGAQLKLDYSRVVMPAADASMATEPLRAPSRSVEPSANDIDVLAMTVTGAYFQDELFLLRGDEFSPDYEDGWDGRKMLGDENAPQLYALSPAGDMAVSATNNLEGTQVAFWRGMDDYYTISFRYSGSEELYLYDAVTNVYTRIADGNEYAFFSVSDDAEERFLITRYNAPGQATGLIDLQSMADGLCLTNTGGEHLLVAIYDAAGRLCHEEATSALMYHVALPSEQGVYVVYVTGEQTKCSYKVVR